MSSERSGFRRYSFHEVAISADRVGVEVENFKTGAIEIFRQPFAGDGHPHAVSRPLPQWPGCGFHPGSYVRLRMSGGFAADLPEALDLLHRDSRIVCNFSLSIDRAHPGQVERGVKKHRGVPRGQNETVTIWPRGIHGVVAKEALPQGVDHRRKTHRRARM